MADLNLSHRNNPRVIDYKKELYLYIEYFSLGRYVEKISLRFKSVTQSQPFLSREKGSRESTCYASQAFQI